MVVGIFQLGSAFDVLAYPEYRGELPTRGPPWVSGASAPEQVIHRGVPLRGLQTSKLQKLRDIPGQLIEHQDLGDPQPRRDRVPRPDAKLHRAPEPSRIGFVSNHLMARDNLTAAPSPTPRFPHPCISLVPGSPVGRSAHRQRSVGRRPRRGAPRGPPLGSTLCKPNLKLHELGLGQG